MQTIFRFCLSLMVFSLLNSAAPSALAYRSQSDSGQIPLAGADSSSGTDSLPGDGFWADGFGQGGVSGPVYDIFRFSGSMCAAGDFYQAGSLTVGNIACWDDYNKTWFTFGEGVSGPVYAVYVDASGNIYAGGNFTQAGTVSAQNIARWNILQNTWEDIGGVSGPIYAMATADNFIYVGGQFIQAGTIEADNVARFDTSKQAWSALDQGLSNGVSGPVYALATRYLSLYEHEVYVGGWFQGIGGVSNVNAYSLARWDSYSRYWSEVTGSINGTNSIYGSVNALALCNTKLYVGGFFNQAGPISAQNLAVMDLSAKTWSTTGLEVSAEVETIQCLDKMVYVGGYFTQAGKISADHIARWYSDTKTWYPLGSGTSGPVFDISAANGIPTPIYVGGSFSTAGASGSQNIALFLGHFYRPKPEDVNWDIETCSLSRRPNGYVNAITASGDILYYGGQFTAIGGVQANHVARFDSREEIWSALGEGVNGEVKAIAVKGSDVYIGGSFSMSGNTPIVNLAHWNSLTKKWEALDGGPDGTVNAIAVTDSSVFAGGSFTTAGGVTVNNIARYDFASHHWSALPLGEGAQIAANGPVYALAVSGSDLYIGGDFFFYIQSLPIRNIARWDGSAWSSLGSGVTDDVYALAVKDNTLYAGGAFYSAGDNQTHSIASWDGAAWHTLGTGLAGAVYALALNRNDVYAGGKMDFGDGVTHFYDVARWDGNQWSPLGSGLWTGVRALAIGAKGLYVGGAFTTLGPGSYLSCSYHALWKTRTTPTGSGSISGSVHSPGGVPLAGGTVQVCPLDGSPCAWIGTTDSNGSYLAPALSDGEYVVKVYPPQGTSSLPALSGSLVISGGSALQQDFNLVEISPQPASVKLTPSRMTGAGTPRVNWRQSLRLETTGCAGSSATYLVQQSGVTITSGALVENPAGVYRASLAPFYPVYGYVQVSLGTGCPALLSQNSTFDVYVDRTGTLKDLNNLPIEGATISLYSYDPLTTALSLVPADSPLLSPVNQVNPDLTDSAGHFGWDMADGVYLIRAEKAGCTSANPPYRDFVQTGLLESSAQLIDLELQMKCTSDTRKIYLPVINR